MTGPFKPDETYHEAKERSLRIRSPADIRPVRWSCNHDKRWVHLTEGEWVALCDAFEELKKKVIAQVDAPAAQEETDAGIEWVFIPSGQVGTICVTQPFLMARTPVTQAQWRKVMDTDPSRFKCDKRPVESVTWYEAVEFCTRIGARLPTEWEWEYACRAGTTGDAYGLIDHIAWHDGNSGGHTQDVACKQPNNFGLYDMLGNVWEWTSSEEGSYRVLRGGSWNNRSADVRASYRCIYAPGTPRYFNLGFRPVKEAP